MDLTPIVAHPATVTLASRFRDAGIPLYVVGGAVRDLVAGSDASPADLDFTTPAHPDTIETLVEGLGTVWEAGRSFGTVGVDIDGMKVEVTTFRTEMYASQSRKPTVAFTDDLATDLGRRDLTINTLAVEVTDGVLIDLFGGEADLTAGLLRTPGDPHTTVLEDPLRQIRTVRFAATRGFRIHPTLASAIRLHRSRLTIVARERITAELDRLVDAGPQVFATALVWANRLGIADSLVGGLPTGPAQIAALGRLHVGDGVNPLAVLGAAVPDLREQLTDLVLPNTFILEVCGQVSDARRLAATSADDVIAVRMLARELTGRRLAVAAALTVTTARPSADTVAAVARELRTYPQLTAPLPVDGHDALAAGLSGRAVGGGLDAVEAALLSNPTLDRAAALHVLATAAA